MELQIEMEQWKTHCCFVLQTASAGLTEGELYTVSVDKPVGLLWVSATRWRVAKTFPGLPAQ